MSCCTAEARCAVARQLAAHYYEIQDGPARTGGAVCGGAGAAAGCGSCLHAASLGCRRDHLSDHGPPLASGDVVGAPGAAYAAP